MMHQVDDEYSPEPNEPVMGQPLAPCVVIEDVRFGELDGWRMRHGQAQALVCRQGAQVLSFGMEGEAPMVWPNPFARFIPGEPIRGGIPVCWPWFAALPANPEDVRESGSAIEQAPFHGLVRQVPWSLLDLGSDRLGAYLVLEHEVLPEQSPHWPQHARVQLSIRLSQARLQLDLQVHNLGKHRLAMTQALHSYYAVSDVRDVQLQGFSGASYFDCQDGWQRREQLAEPHLLAETERIYQGLGQRLTIHDPGWGRRILVETSGSRSAILWNPWIEKARRLDQFEADAWTGILCIETARVMDDRLVLESGDSAMMSVVISRELCG